MPPSGDAAASSTSVSSCTLSRTSSSSSPTHARCSSAFRSAASCRITAIAASAAASTNVRLYFVGGGSGATSIQARRCCAGMQQRRLWRNRVQCSHTCKADSERKMVRGERAEAHVHRSDVSFRFDQKTGNFKAAIPNRQMQWSSSTAEKQKNQLAQTEFRFIKTIIIIRGGNYMLFFAFTSALHCSKRRQTSRWP